MVITDLLEAIMILCFGLSWPISIKKSYTSRTAKGKSLYFEVFIWIGYVFGIVRKAILLTPEMLQTPGEHWIFFLGWAFYIFNIIAITTDILLYFRNVSLDKQADAAAKR